MAKITIEELSRSLKEYLNGLGLTEAQVQELIDKFEDEKIGDISQLSTEEKGNLVGAINELFQNANNGKELIANAIGEPLDSNDTFSAMSSDINGLLSTFKTNMMNSGIMVESNDKFKQLIDKIVTLADNEGKGIQYAEGMFNVRVNGNFYVADVELNFEPSIIILRTDYNYDPLTGALVTGYTNILYNVFNSSDKYFVIDCYSSNMTVIEKTLTQTGNKFTFSLNLGNHYTLSTNKYYAIGVGEEDTTLRDSLASILEEEGVSVTEEDDMSSLISKVDSEFDRKNEELENSGGLDIISATELPATGKENQICVISSNPVNKYNITTMSSFNSGNDCYDILLNTSSTEYNYLLNIGNLTYTYNISRVWLNKNNCSSYYYTGTQWKQLTQATLYVYKDGVFGAPCGLVSSQTTTPVQVYIQTDSSKSYYNNLAIKYIGNSIGNAIALFSTDDRVDLTAYSKLTFVFTPILSNGYPLIEFGLSDDRSYMYSSDWSAMTTTINIRDYSNRSLELSIDLTNINKSYYISFRIYTNNTSSQPAADVYIESVILE